ncbi:hypothetical protein BDF21DRAFT_489607 [Thamnidium elegans]|nr:hypothetical protein BDF21DRAFT_489607 [Thamnidium elegans]
MQLSGTMTTVSKIDEKDNLYADDVQDSIGMIFKNAEIQKHHLYNHLDSTKQSIICLGLNSILDISAKYPERQTTLINKKHIRT